MKSEKIARGLAYILSFLLFFTAIYGFFRGGNIVSSIIALVLCIFLNPKFQKYFSKLNNIKEIKYLTALLPTIFVLALIISVVVARLLTNSSTTENEFNGIVKIMLYISSLLILIMYNNFNRKKMFIIFGSVYVLFTAISISNDVVSNLIAQLLNILPNNNITSEDVFFACNNILTPIKEAILTYIIFEVIKLEK